LKINILPTDTSLTMWWERDASMTKPFNWSVESQSGITLTIHFTVENLTKKIQKAIR